LKTGILKLEVHADNPNSILTSAPLPEGVKHVLDREWQGLLFVARPSRGSTVATMNARARELSYDGWTIRVGNPPGVGGVFRGTVWIRMHGRRVDVAIAGLKHYYESMPTLSRLMAFGGFNPANYGASGEPQDNYKQFVDLANRLIA
jgi:hypothetical protein